MCVCVLRFLPTIPCYSPSVLRFVRHETVHGQLRRRLCARRNDFFFAVRGALGQRGCRAVWRRLVCCVRACVRVCQRWETGREEGRGGGEKEMSMRACACVWTCIINLLHIRLGCIAGAIIGGLVGVVSFASVVFYCHRSVEVW